MVVQIVRFKSRLPDGEVLALYEARAPRYRALAGLNQKYYLRFSEDGEYGAVYIWESEAALAEFRESDLGRTISSTYQVQGTPESTTGEVVLALHA